MGYTADMIVADIVNSHDRAKDVLLSFGLNCSECVVAWSESLATGLSPHGIDPAIVIAKLDRDAPRPDPQSKKKKRRQASS